MLSVMLLLDLGVRPCVLLDLNAKPRIYSTLSPSLALPLDTGAERVVLLLDLH